jgi:hypothetical protein
VTRINFKLYLTLVLLFIFPFIVKYEYLSQPFINDELDYLKFLVFYPEMNSWKFSRVADLFFKIGFDGHAPIPYIFSYINWLIFESISALRTQYLLFFSLGTISFFYLIKDAKKKLLPAISFTLLVCFNWTNLEISNTPHSDYLQILAVSLYFVFLNRPSKRFRYLSSFFMLFTRETNAIFFVPKIITDILNKKFPKVEILSLFLYGIFTSIYYFTTKGLYQYSGVDFLSLGNIHRTFFSLLTLDHIFFTPSFAYRVFIPVIVVYSLYQYKKDKDLFTVLLTLSALAHLFVFSIYEPSVYKPRLIMSSLIPLSLVAVKYIKGRASTLIFSSILVVSFTNFFGNSFHRDIRKMDQEQISNTKVILRWINKYSDQMANGIEIDHPFGRNLSSAHYGYMDAPLKLNKFDKEKSVFKISFVSESKLIESCPWRGCIIKESIKSKYTNKNIYLLKKETY